MFYPVARINSTGFGSSKESRITGGVYPPATMGRGYAGEPADHTKCGLAERVGIEPTVELPRQQFSRLPDSAALAPLRCVGFVCES